MNLWVRRLRGLCLVGMVLAGAVFCTALGAVATAGYASAQSAGAIVVEGNRRVEADTIRSYFRLNPGERLDSYKIDQALKALYATGLFQDVRINPAGGRLVVTVIENPVINRVAFEGNSKLKDDQLSNEVQSKPRGTLSRPTVQADVQRIVEITGATAASTPASSPRSSSFRTTASIWCSRSRKPTRPALKRSSLSATKLMATSVCWTKSRPTKLRGFGSLRFSSRLTFTIRTASKPIVT